jgi:predicted transcriptional regulator
MRLIDPSDFEILGALSNGKRNTAANLSFILGKDRSYVNTRLPVLEDYNLLKKIGPNPQSGLYEITEKGLTVYEIYQSSSKSPSEIDFENRLQNAVSD